MTENAQLPTASAARAAVHCPWSRPSLPEPVDESTPAKSGPALGFRLSRPPTDLPLRTWYDGTDGEPSPTPWTEFRIPAGTTSAKRA